MKTLAADVKTILGSSVKVSYGADWSEYNNYNPGDGTGDLFFHLDPLWSDSNIDFVGVDLYVPLSDWRDGNAHLDALGGAPSIYDKAYLQSNCEGGEYFAWFYASQADRDAQIRTPISDGAYGKPWVFRAKDFRNWWLNQHYDRPGGVENATPTAWAPQSKPIWFTEFGSPSVDKGTNQPNVFYDPKSSESALPYYSNGNRDDIIQRKGIEALISYWNANNPASTGYGGPMVGLIAVWTWDARPYLAWPGRTDIWSDGALWPLGHWLNGKVGLADLGALVARRCERAGLTQYDVSGLNGTVTGYFRDRPMSPRAEIELLMQAYAFDAAESEGALRFKMRGGAKVGEFEPEDCVLPERGDIITLTRAQETDLPDIVAVTFIDGNKAYDSGTIQASRTSGYSDRKIDVSLPIVMDQGAAQLIADRMLAEAWAGRETARFGLAPQQIALDAGDVINLVVDGRAREFRLTRITDAWGRSIEAQKCEAEIYGPPLPGTDLPGVDTPPDYGPALLEFMDLPMLTDEDIPYAPHAAASSTPFAGVTLLDSPTGDNYGFDTDLPLRAIMGESLTPFYAGPTEYFDIVNTLRVKLYSGELTSLSEDTVLASRQNAIAVKNADGDWEIAQFCNATLVASGTYDLTKLLRGRLGSEHAMRSPVAIGARVVVLDNALPQISAGIAERGQTRYYKWGPSPVDPMDEAWQTTTFVARAVGLMPWPPVHVKGVRNGAGDLTITWVRRTRFGGVWADGTDVPLNEESERYEIDILDGSTAVRTIAVTSPSATYTAVQQIADFGSAQASVSLKIYQLSATVGRGWPAAATL